MVTPSILRANFPDDVPLPDLLVRLCAYTEATGNESLGGDLTLTDHGRQSRASWFRSYPDQAPRFIIFATDRSGSLYGYWRDEGHSLDRAPLVYLNDEGVDSTVLADTLGEFLTLIAVGQSSLGMVGEWDEAEDPDLSTGHYRLWLREELGIAAPTLSEARAIVESARATHPDLDRWVEHLVTGQL